MATPKNMPEEFLQYIWQNRLFTNENLSTVEGDRLEIIDPGRINTDSGPDFFNAKIKIKDTIWAGNIEIHKKASDWQKHEHNNDKAYDNVILHVVETADAKITRSNGENIPTFTLNYPEQYKLNYQNLLDAQTWIACQNQFHKIDPIILQLGFNRLMIERLENKTQAIVEQLEQNNNNWDETFFQVLARMLGFKVNALPFELLAKSTPIQILLKHKNSLFQLEALLFGNSGLLNQQLLGDDYFIRLRDEYSFLYKKYKLKGIESHLWKFMRLRPSNFPTIRISQLAALIYRWQGLFSRILETESIENVKALLKVKTSEYWDTHYNFNKSSKGTKPKELGDVAATILIINVIVPFLFVYGEKQNKTELKNRALGFLENLPAESNSIISKWKELGIQARSAFESQALLQLKNCYCESKKCLNCQIGVKLVSSLQNQDD
ncbi:DUF2851 family protein [Draconibacterium sp. IB214405]|uniref:DUF2851 family protein n=1 Tax=Draconibacterium sp. IB214405 TaxID=3097352 RepID=UPI002A14EB76|nr:DUF2851 family protein [Draconibacterium sp. IB214405]MDX8340868.1 DUF2851 family protein [Draconibacterium sp. IB214405]